MKKYVATRKDICAGELTRAEQGIFNLCVSEKHLYRGMLFNVNEDGLANDLIYTTPTNYPIEGIEPKIEFDSEFVISNYVELEELLKCLNYGEDLTQKDLDQIFRKLITSGYWEMRHIELFGWQKCKAGYFDQGGSVKTFPKIIYDKLSCISGSNGKPNKNEPGYGLIKKRK